MEGRPNAKIKAAENLSLENCVFAKTVLMMVVILYHSVYFWSGNWFSEEPVFQSKILVYLASFLGGFHVHGFTLISGYLFAYRIRGGGYGEYFPYILNKAKRLLIPYLFVMPIWVAPISEYFFRWDLWQLFKKYVLCINPSQLWFLWMLFGVFAIAWPLKRLMTEKPVIGWLIALAFYGIGVAGDRVLPNMFCVWNAFGFFPFFFIGIRIRVREEEGKGTALRPGSWMIWAGVYILLFALVQFLDGSLGTGNDAIRAGVSFVRNAAGAAAAFGALQRLAPLIPWKRSGLFRKLASYSMPMYLFHQQIIYFVIVWLNGKVNPWINAGANFVLSALGAFLISALLMRWKTTRLLIGEK